MLAGASLCVAFILQGCDIKAGDSSRLNANTANMANTGLFPSAHAFSSEDLRKATAAIPPLVPAVIDSPWCGYNFQPQAYPDDNIVVDCSCCASHLMISPKDYAALLYGSGPTEFNTWITNEARESRPFLEPNVEGHEAKWYKAPGWSLGGRRATLFCDSDRLLCHCADLEKAWEENQLVCSNGAQCRPPSHASELVSDVVEMASTGGTAVSDCDSISGRRASLGKARCADAKVESCNRLYAKEPRGAAEMSWHYCEVSSKPKVCSAKGMTKKEAAAKEHRIRNTALKHWFNPGLNWKVTFDSNAHTFSVDPQQDYQEFFNKQVRERQEFAAVQKQIASQGSPALLQVNMTTHNLPQ